MCGSPFAPPVEVVGSWGSLFCVVHALQRSPHFHWMAELLIPCRFPQLAVAFGEFRRNDAKWAWRCNPWPTLVLCCIFLIRRARGTVPVTTGLANTSVSTLDARPGWTTPMGLLVEPVVSVLPAVCRESCLQPPVSRMWYSMRRLVLIHNLKDTIGLGGRSFFPERSRLEKRSRVKRC